jgi:hypothetical protein
MLFDRLRLGFTGAVQYVPERGVLSFALYHISPAKRRFPYRKGTFPKVFVKFVFEEASDCL